MRCLLDVNGLVALTFPTHAFHERTQKWFRIEKKRPWASYALTQGGYLRSAVHMIGKSHDAIDEALEMLQQIGVGQVADMQLLMMAYESDALLVTFEQGIRELARGTKLQDSLLVL